MGTRAIFHIVDAEFSLYYHVNGRPEVLKTAGEKLFNILLNKNLINKKLLQNDYYELYKLIINKNSTIVSAYYESHCVPFVSYRARYNMLNSKLNIFDVFNQNQLQEIDMQNIIFETNWM